MLRAANRVKSGSPGPVIYRALKFRTMVEGADSMGPALREELDREGGDVLFKIEDDPRVTGAGRTLRSWSIEVAGTGKIRRIEGPQAAPSPLGARMGSWR